MSEYAKARLKGYLRTFIYMSLCGILFIFGGGAFFIHESIKMANQNKDSNDKATNHGASGSQEHQGEVVHTSVKAEGVVTSSYVTELRIVGYVFLSVGIILLCIGIPFAYQFWKRYQRAKEIESCPMLDPDYSEKLKKAYSKKHKRHHKRLKAEQGQDQNAAEQEDNSESLMDKQEKKFWKRRKVKNISKETFGLGSHHHPAFNRVPIEGLAALSRYEMQEFTRFSDVESEEETASHANSSEGSNKKSPKSRDVQRTSNSLFNKMFAIDDEQTGSSDDEIDNLVSTRLDGELPKDAKQETERFEQFTALNQGSNGQEQ